MFLSALAGAQAAPPVQWLSEDYPPYSFVSTTGPKGIAVDLMKATLAKAGLPEGRLVFLPWARVLQVLGEPAPACVTTMTRTAAREARYQWAGPFLPDDIVVARKTPAPPWPRGDKPLAGRTVVVVRGDVSEEAARTLGAEEARMHRVATPDLAARMLLADRVDGWIYGEPVLHWTLAALGTPPERYRVDGRVKIGDNYFACNARVSPDYVKRLQQGLDAVKQSRKGGRSEYDQIVASYLKASPAAAK